MSRLLHLLLLVGALCGPAAAFVGGRDAKRQVNDVLTEKLFAVSNMLTTIEEHVRRLESWDGSVSGIEARLVTLEAGQQRAGDQLAAVLRRVNGVTESTAAVRAELTEVATSQASTAAAISTLRTDLTASVAGVGESVAGLTGSHAAQHEQTRGACRESGAQLSQPLEELRTAVGQATELAQRTEEALSGGLERVDGRIQETTQELEKLGLELREERQKVVTTTTPAPTINPQQAFLNSLYRSLSKRTEEKRTEE